VSEYITLTRTVRCVCIAHTTTAHTQVRQTIPMEHLRDLSKEIGFSDADQVTRHNLTVNSLLKII
jgi:hypothetical protein